MKFSFEHWPIFNRNEFNETKELIFKNILDYELDPDVDIRIIGSDVNTYRDYIDKSGIANYRHHPNFNRTCDFKENPLIPSYHFPDLNRRHHQQLSDYVEGKGSELVSSKPGSLMSQEPPFFSFYRGDFETVAGHLMN